MPRKIDDSPLTVQKSLEKKKKVKIEIG